MTVQAEIVGSSARSQVQLEHELPLLGVCINEDEHLISEIAQQIFTTHYDKLFEIKNARFIELSNLIKQKHLLEKTWIPRLAQGIDSQDDPPIYFYICVSQLIASTALCFGFIIGGSTRIGVGIGGTAIAILCLELLVPCIPCVSNVVENHEKVSSKISVIRKQQQEVIQLIKFTNVFAKFCVIWPQLIEEVKNENYKKTFKMLKGLLKEYDADIVKIAGEQFLHLAPLFLMETVCTLSPNGELASSWKHIKGSPALWEDNNLWEKVQLKNPSVTDYTDFFKTFSKNSEADPSKWSMWFEEKLKNFIEKSKSDELFN